MNDKFSILLEDLSEKLGMSLKPDEHRSCLIRIQDKIDIQLELDQTETYLVMGTQLTELSPGKTRETILLEGLKENAMRYPRLGVFAYSKKLNTLILFERLQVDHFTTDNILSIFTPFVKKAMIWKDALMNGHTHPGEYSLDDDSQNPFGV